MRIMEKSKGKQRIKHLSRPLVILTLVWLIEISWVLRITKQDLTIPLSDGDLLWTYAYQDSIWHWHGFVNHHYGFPFGQNNGFFPTLDLLPTGLVGLIFLFTRNIITSVNLYFLMCILISGFTTYYVAKKFRLLNRLATFVGIAAMTLPWIPGRVFHSEYYLYSVCLLALIISNENKSKLIKLQSVLIGLATGACGPYLAIFSLIIMSVNFTLDLARNKKFEFKKLNNYIYAICSNVLMQLVSFVIFTHTSNFQISTQLGRNISDSVHYGGYGFLLVLPLPWIPIKQLSPILSVFEKIPYSAETTGYSNFGSLLLLCAAFFILISLVLNASNLNKLHLRNLAIVLLVLFLFFTKGGLGPFVAAGISPAFRAWNRIAPILQVILLLIAAIYFQSLKSAKHKMTLAAFAWLLLLLQIGSLTILAPKNQEKNWTIDKSTALQIQANTDSNCGILQLPLLNYPEGGGIGAMQPYDHLRLSLIDNTRKYSFGYGREFSNQEIIREIEKSSFSNLHKNGFCGVVIFKPGDKNHQIEKNVINDKSLQKVFSNNRYTYFRVLF